MKDVAEMRVALIQGGLSAERDVSLDTGKAFESALKELGLSYVVVDANEFLPKTLAELKPDVDVALLALHGKLAEDGVVQGICEYLRIPYTGAGVLGSALSFDKLYTKQTLSTHGIPNAAYKLYDMRSDSPQVSDVEFGFPCVVKPTREGSSVGVTIVNESNQFEEAIQLAAKYDNFILVEEFLEGPEIAVPVFIDKALTPIEIRPKSGFYSYESKYTSGKTDYIMPPELDESVIKEMQELALKVQRVCRVRTYSRVDFRLHKGSPFVVEINTLPGCTETSLVPKSAAREGISFPEFIKTLLQHASLDYEKIR